MDLYRQVAAVAVLEGPVKPQLLQTAVLRFMVKIILRDSELVVTAAREFPCQSLAHRSSTRQVVAVATELALTAVTAVLELAVLVDTPQHLARELQILAPVAAARVLAPVPRVAQES
jgi:hypothetical protein